jgi:Transcription factor S-II (TFIIS)
MANSFSSRFLDFLLYFPGVFHLPAPLAYLTGAIGETATSLSIKPSDLLRRLSGRVAKGSGPAEEAVVDEECTKCKRKGLSYHTAQLRGLDEGQTIFYTCLNTGCQHKFNVNS